MFGATEKSFMWILATVSLITVGTVWACSESTEHAEQPTVTAVPTVAPAAPAAGVAPAVPQTVYVQQPAEHHSGTGDLVNGMLIGHMLSGSNNSAPSTHTVQHVYHPSPAATPAAYHAPAPAPHVTPAAPAPKPAFQAVSRPVSAIKTTSSTAVRSSPSSFRAAPARSFSGGHR